MNDDTKRALLAVVISGFILFGWQIYFGKPTQVQNQTVTSKAEQVGTTSVEQTIENSKESSQVISTVREDHKLLGTDGNLQITNNMAVTSIVNNQAVFDFPSVVESTDFPLQIYLKDGQKYQEVFLQFTNEGSDLVGKNGSLGISVKIAPNKSAGRYDVVLTSAQPQLFAFKMKGEKKELQNRQIREFAVLLKDVVRSKFGSSLKEEGAVKWFGIDFNYHLFAVVFPERITSVVELKESGDFELNTVQSQNSLSFSYVFAKKNYDDLVAMGDNLNLAVDFGILGVVAVPLLRGLQFFYDFLPNYGVAIIILTLLVRIATFPLQYKSFKSMKKMQELQPELNKIKEKYKDDAQKMQKETMELFKRAGANPLGGCLPLLAQMPVFFAFYKVLYSAVELVNAPFFGWIHDLSAKDPFYILPLLMTAAMWLQQKITPSTTADPTQQKIMMFMPLVFGLIMKDLPSGLVLYIFVSTLAGIVQQMLVYKTSK